MRVCLRLSKEVFDFLDISAGNRKYCMDKQQGSFRIRYNLDTNHILPLHKSTCVARSYTLVRLKTLKELILLPTDEVRKAYLDSIKNKRK